VIPSVVFENPVIKEMAFVARQFAWIAIIFLFPAVFSTIESLRKRRLLDRQSGIESVRSLSWKEFEELLAEAYRRQGYVVIENAYTGPDGGIDLTIMRDGNVYLVQCKQWRAYKVGVNIVREMLGLITANRATGGIIVTSGMFTQEAMNFADGKTIDLVEGNQLAALIRNVQLRPTVEVQDGRSATAMKCPKCGMDLVVREAKRGDRIGSKFLGCSGFPKCRYTKEYSD
jgi:restriction system protein